MLAQALRVCPDERWFARLWDDPYAAFWNIAYHAHFLLDLHLSGSPDGFVPLAPLTLGELDPADKLPAYAAHTQRKTGSDAGRADGCGCPPAQRLSLGRAELR